MVVPSPPVFAFMKPETFDLQLTRFKWQTSLAEWRNARDADQSLQEIVGGLTKGFAISVVRKNRLNPVPACASQMGVRRDKCRRRNRAERRASFGSQRPSLAASRSSAIGEGCSIGRCKTAGIRGARLTNSEQFELPSINDQGRSK